MRSRQNQPLGNYLTIHLDSRKRAMLCAMRYAGSELVSDEYAMRYAGVLLVSDEYAMRYAGVLLVSDEYAMRYAGVLLVSNDFSRGEKKPRRSGARIAGELKRIKAGDRVLAGFKRALLYC